MSSQLRLTAYAALATIATATALRSVFAGYGWVVPVMGGVILVAASCAAVRYSPLPSALEPVTAALVVLCWITAFEAPHEAHFGFIPGRAAFRHLSRVASNGFTEIHKLPAPVPTRHGVVLLTIVGVAAIALVVDLMVVTLRRAALSGLPLLALFTICAATGHHGVSVVPFVIASAGYLWLLYADNKEKVARWGAAVGTGSRARPASAWTADATNATAPSSLGRRVGVMAIGLGILVPFAIPGLHTGIDKHVSGTGGDGGGGGGNITTFNPIVTIASDLSSSANTQVLTYRSTATNPGYLRLTSLDQFDGTTFSSPTLMASANNSASEHLPVTPGSGSSVSTTVSVTSDLHLNWLPVQTTVVGVSVGDAWRYDPSTATIFSATTNTGGLHYSVNSVASVPTASEVDAAGVDPPSSSLDGDLSLTGVSPAIKALTKSITASADGNHYLEAIAIQRWFTEGNRFTYSTAIPAGYYGNHPLADFLLHRRKGFCQQFATAMTVMARLEGIPARVAVGFTQGTKEKDGTWSVTTHDAHAWPELWFQGYGWLAFEPTPRGDGQAVTPSYAKGLTKTPTKPGATTTKKNNASTGPTTGVKHPITRDQNGPAVTGLQTHHHASDIAAWVALGVLGVLLVLLTIPGFTRQVVRRRRRRLMTDPAAAPGAAWAELRDTVVDLRGPWDDGRSPRQVAAVLSPRLRYYPEARAALIRLSRAEERSRYAPASDASIDDLRADLVLVRSTLFRREPTAGRRYAAILLPRSAMNVVGNSLASWGLRVGRGRETLVRTVRRLLRPRRPITSA